MVESISIESMSQEDSKEKEMKKALFVIALIALVVVPVAAKGIETIGLEVGEPTGIVAGYSIDKTWNGYTKIGLGFISGNKLDIITGAEYKIAEFKVEREKFDINVGGQTGLRINLGQTSVEMPLYATGAIAYDWRWKDVGSFTAYIRLGFGLSLQFKDNFSVVPAGNGVIGCVYHL